MYIYIYTHICICTHTYIYIIKCTALGPVRCLRTYIIQASASCPLTSDLHTCAETCACKHERMYACTHTHTCRERERETETDRERDKEIE